MFYAECRWILWLVNVRLSIFMVPYCRFIFVYVGQLGEYRITQHDVTLVLITWWNNLECYLYCDGWEKQQLSSNGMSSCGFQVDAWPTYDLSSISALFLPLSTSVIIKQSKGTIFNTNVCCYFASGGVLNKLGACGIHNFFFKYSLSTHGR